MASIVVEQLTESGVERGNPTQHPAPTGSCRVLTLGVGATKFVLLHLPLFENSSITESLKLQVPMRPLIKQKGKG